MPLQPPDVLGETRVQVVARLPTQILSQPIAPERPGDRAGAGPGRRPRRAPLDPEARNDPAWSRHRLLRRCPTPPADVVASWAKESASRIAAMPPAASPT